MECKQCRLGVFFYAYACMSKNLGVLWQIMDGIMTVCFVTFVYFTHQTSNRKTFIPEFIIYQGYR